jgi:hypothetical protein
MAGVTDECPIAHRYRLLAPQLTEHELRMWAAVEAASYGKGGITTLARITGIAASTIRRAQQELQIDKPPATQSSTPRYRSTPNSEH